MDTNNDGVISEEEFLEGCEKVRKLKDKFCNYLKIYWSQMSCLWGKIVFFSVFQCMKALRIL